MESRRLLLALLLSMAILFLWRELFPPPELPAPPPQGVEAPAPGAQGAPEAATAVSPAAEPGPPGIEPAGEAPAPAAEPALAEPPIEAGFEESIVIESEEIRAELSNRGARLVSFQLKEHPNDEGMVNLVRRRSEMPYPFSITGPGGEPSPLDGALFAVERGRGEGGEDVVEFRYRGEAGFAEKRFAFRDDGLFDVEIRRQGPGGWGVFLGPGLRNPSAEELASRFAWRSAVYRQGAKIETIDPLGTTEPKPVSGADLDWIGLQDTYFLAVMIPAEGLAEALIEPVLVRPGTGREPAAYSKLPADGKLSDEEEDLGREMTLVLRPSGDILSGKAFFGAKVFDRLADMPYGFEDTVELGWFKFLSLPLLWGLQWVHENVVSNYGWAIILMTVLIRIVLFPLMHKSTVSMQKMQELNPKVEAIRAKYRSKLKTKEGRPNPEARRKMNEEVMALYRTEGANPASGCLPMLLQIPVLFAFYNLLSTAIELRHAPWLLWVKDLSAPDPFYVLPIVMGASQFVQQKITPTTGDPMQRKIFMVMPVLFTVLFLGFPSGLVLYWLTNNVLAIAQQAIYMKMKERSKEPEEEGKGQKKRSAKKKKG